MAASEDLLWDADDKSMQMVPRLRRIGVTAGCLGFFGLLMWTDSDATWVLYAGAVYLLGEIAYWGWDRRRLVEARIVPGGADGPARVRLRRVGGRTTEHDPQHVTRVVLIHDNVHDLATLRLNVHGRQRLFGRPARPPALTTLRHTCPKAEVSDRAARWGMPGIPD
ncbi:hypothetical protein RM704_06040 [Streptomyces sp. DSM 3412]|uniref:Integral membrane protein n=1 Tax=Streptomyces gottesmaniae TaxID=3075518 RepID=A0ABU2YS23_9ACTN|nr:hypothetical protein [Streptomyces sp. DSM 3412]MDT0567046.1 hypothetical protein [Streptomyces sp. DSM 3412]